MHVTNAGWFAIIQPEMCFLYAVRNGRQWSQEPVGIWRLLVLCLWINRHICTPKSHFLGSCTHTGHFMCDLIGFLGRLTPNPSAGLVFCYSYHVERLTPWVRAGGRASTGTELVPSWVVDAGSSPGPCSCYGSILPSGLHFQTRNVCRLASQAIGATKAEKCRFVCLFVSPEPGWPRTHRTLPASASQVLELKACATTTWNIDF